MHHDGFTLKDDNDPRWKYSRNCGCRMCHAHEVAELERKVRRKSRPWFKRWCVTVMDNWTPTQTFWTYDGAKKFWRAHSSCAYLYHWQADKWTLCEGPF